MFSRSSILTKVYALLISFILLGFIIIGFTSYKMLSSMENRTLEAKAHYLKVALDEQVGAKNATWITNSLLLSINNNIQNAIISGNRESLIKTFSGIGKMYRENTPLKG